ncbi:MAG: 1-phosphofructokinase family hexose kinase [Armatimonadetes bacterium]|nr:1-phosphofructokinase family hexose kinase [Armatimonadota bacterium]
MILTVTANPALDRSYRVEPFGINRVHRPLEWQVLAGGKGINVSRIVNTLGGSTCALCLLGGPTGRAIEAALRFERIEVRVVRLAEESRTCITVIDPAAHTQTEVNEPGPQVSPAELRRLLQAVRQSMRVLRPTWLALCGRLPAGIDQSAVAQMVDDCRTAGVRCAVDTSGPALAEAVARRVDLIKPNEAELGALMGRPVATVEAAVDAAAELARRSGVRVAATLGAGGAVYADGRSVWHAAPPPVSFVSALGSGDSFLGAFCEADAREAPVEERLARAVGAGSANAEVMGAAMCRREAIERCAGLAVVRRLR